MPKVKLNLEPSDRLTYTQAVRIPTPDGSELSIEFEFLHRTRSELAKFIDQHVAQARADIEAATAAQQAQATAPADGKTATQAPAQPAADLQAATLDREVALLRGIAVGWGVEGYPFDDRSLRAFCDRYAGAAAAVAADYRLALEHGRLGN